MANIIDQIRSGRPSIGTGGDSSYKMQDTFELDGLATADVLYCFTVPNLHRVENVTQIVVEDTGEICVDEVGIYSDLVGTAVDADGFEASADLHVAAGHSYTGVAADALVASGGWLNTTGADAYIGIVPTVAASPLGTTGKVKVVASMRDES